ncbi:MULTISPECIES: four-helix bundle copper-binding protein [Hydrocarboniphaga]|jgi:hypothetical protein|uniref:Ferredoxin n=1 Tax=Hydrocarboniphaga effusa AP103 TaxID=1172194 RepID=I8TEF7_9GAMM|nr:MULTISPECIES: four-helix bundle copper-binding protein [Hydrocarboniphaga]EIT72073.1 hypothetical protein WQQ_22100 [Hydrocarboniphaga effusa AP103]MDZ4080606.1 four-helix bundle copper-binding protein [Hydrocarboniphaga sp.]
MATSNSQLHSASSMQDCIDACSACAEICWRMATTHCLEKGGAHVRYPHLALMLNCAVLCRTAAQFMLSGLEQHRHVCAACAKVCAACAEDCGAIDDMQDCADACRRCASSCAAMGGEAQA